jgi:hypothetical protein
MRRSTRALGAALVALAACACGSDQTSAMLGTGHWGPYDVEVETRPAPPRAGNNEVVVMVTGELHRPVYDALVHLRADPAAPWVQAIEDGHVGVYRRAVNFNRDTTMLDVQLRRGDEMTVMAFPVTIGALR